jgi:alpha 1,2-mannosyltransferase
MPWLTKGCQISIHYIVSFTHESYGRATAISNITSKFRPSSSSNSGRPDKFPTHNPGSSWSPGGNANETLVVDKHANATFVILARNSDLQGTVKSVREIEDRFNKKYRYPYVFLNEVPFTDDFKRWVLSFRPFLTFATEFFSVVVCRC